MKSIKNFIMALIELVYLSFASVFERFRLAYISFMTMRERRIQEFNKWEEFAIKANFLSAMPPESRKELLTAAGMTMGEFDEIMATGRSTLAQQQTIRGAVVWKGEGTINDWFNGEGKGDGNE